GASPLRVPQVLQQGSRATDQVVFENYDDKNYGYLRTVVTADQLRIEYHAASDGPNIKAPDDSVTVDLASRDIGHFAATDQGRAAAIKTVQADAQRLARQQKNAAAAPKRAKRARSRR
ncbi:MAG: hypothetical protein JO128_19245, partial [Alphaproteobacteria bacterium]|nr:hypothetical protein [Alphaproteobacteria bacterium]